MKDWDEQRNEKRATIEIKVKAGRRVEKLHRRRFREREERARVREAWGERGREKYRQRSQGG